MEVLRTIEKNSNLAIALGFFDGLHVGHRKIISTLINEAKVKGYKTAIVTFANNPNDYFSEEKTLNIQTFKDRELLLEALGIDYLYELDFEEYKDISAEDYIKEILVKNLDPKLIVMGYNHTFGKDRQGTPSLIDRFSTEYGYECIVVPEQKYKDNQISSTEIRKRIEHGHLSAIKALLGRYFSVRNSVIKGDRLARTLGFPTANLVWPNSMVKLPHGVYAGFVQIGSNLHPSLISWGTKPTFGNKTELIEAHIQDFDKDLYGKIIKVIFARKLRDQMEFSNINALKAQIQKDYKEFQKWVYIIKQN